MRSSRECPAGGCRARTPPVRRPWRAGIPETVPAYTINKVCGSGLKAVGWRLKPSGRDGDVFVVGGMESMSTAPLCGAESALGSPYGP